jgi:hypothetical protein
MKGILPQCFDNTSAMLRQAQHKESFEQDKSGSVADLLKIIFVLLVSGGLFSCSPKINPDKPNLSRSNFKLDSLPDSQINIPIQINLKPLYAYAEKNVDTIFTSPNYPNDWIYDGCGSRYKYSFRRSPLQLKAAVNSLKLGFMGYYKITGSTRACLNGTAVSPWSSPCRCGFNEDERRVNVQFTNSVNITPDYKILLSIKREEPVPLDKCEVCFWGQDITGLVMKGLRSELDLAKTDMEKNYGVTNIKPKVQLLWDELNKIYSLPSLGFLKLNPQRLHVNNLYAEGDSLHIHLGLSARPVVSFEKPIEVTTAVPPMQPVNTTNGFNIFLDAVLNYDSLNSILNANISGKTFDIDKGPVKRKFVVKECKLMGSGNEKLIVKVDFGGDEQGIAYLVGKPVYDAQTKMFEIKSLDFDIKTKDALLKAADWLFNRRIVNEISRYTKFDLSQYIETAKAMMNAQLNKEWMPGIRSNGIVNDLKLTGIYPTYQYLVIRSNCSGFLSIEAETIPFSF